MSIPPYTSKDFYVKVTESSMSDVILPSVLLGDCQEVAEDAVVAFGVDTNNLNARGFCWIVLRMSVEIDRLPKWKETFKLNTWSCGTKSLVWRRDYEIVDETNTIIGNSTSEWIVADINTHRPIRPSNLIDAFSDYPDYKYLSESQNDKRALPYSAPKLSFPDSLDELSEPIISKFADYSELDHNHHVNNTRYIAWSYDALYQVGVDIDSIKRFDINYHMEVKSGERVDIYYRFEEDYHYIYGYKNGNDKVFVFRCI